MTLMLDGAAAESDDMDASLQEKVLLDENAQAQKHSFYMVRGFEVRSFGCCTPMDSKAHGMGAILQWCCICCRQHAATQAPWVESPIPRSNGM